MVVFIVWNGCFGCENSVFYFEDGVSVPYILYKNSLKWWNWCLKWRFGLCVAHVSGMETGVWLSETGERMVKIGVLSIKTVFGIVKTVFGIWENCGKMKKNDEIIW